MKYSLEALGSVVRELREAKIPRLTQQELGVRAGYGGGAGVAISRIECGLTRPSLERLAGINDALGLMPGEIAARAVRRTEELATSADDRPTGTAGESLRARLHRVERTVQERTEELSAVVDRFNEAHDRARDEFFLPFVRSGESILNARPPVQGLDDVVPQEGASVEAAAQFRLQCASYGVAKALTGAAAGAAVGGVVGPAAAYAAFRAAVLWGTASTGIPISGLSGIAASNAALALLGGGTLAAGGKGVAGGTALLTGLVAGPAVVLAVGVAAAVAARWTRRQQRELEANLDEVEGHLRTQARGVRAFTDLVGQAADILDYIAVHGGHAHDRWSNTLGAPVQWDALSPAQQERHDDFVQLCAAQLSVSTLDVQPLLVLTGDELEQEIGLIDQLLEKSDDLVRTRV